jgi:hypothetical protein
MAFPVVINVYGAVIAAGQSLSSSYTSVQSGVAAGGPINGGVMMGADTLVGIQMPATWVAAGITFQVSPDGGATWCELYDDAGNEVTITTPVASSFIVLDNHPSSMWRGINAIKVRSGTAGAPVVQTGGATVNLIGRPEMY